jgi:hypothetical protein
MFDRFVSSKQRVLDPAVRVSEILFGLIMVLTFTGSLSVAEAGREDVRLMLIGALGCNLAWGIIDGLLFLMDGMIENGRARKAYFAVREAGSPAEANRLISDSLPPVLASVVQPQELEGMRERLLALPEPPERAALGRDDWAGALGVFFLVFLSIFPVAIPFMVMREVGPALRVSNAVAVALLFLCGYVVGRISGRHAWLMGLLMVVIGSLLVAITIALGG